MSCQIEIKVQEAEFCLTEVNRSITENRTDIGAVVTFSGLVRDFNEQPDVLALTLEHYPGMTEQALEQIAAEAAERWPLQAVHVIHRVGRLTPGDPIVLVAVASAHRQAAFDGCSFVMDFLKTRAPFWKKENTRHGDYWVSARRSDDAAARRWKEGEV